MTSVVLTVYAIVLESKVENNLLNSLLKGDASLNFSDAVKKIAPTPYNKIGTQYD